MQPPQNQGVQQLQNSNYQILYQQYLNQCLQQGYDATTAQALANQYALQAVADSAVNQHGRAGLEWVVAVAIVGILTLVVVLAGILYAWASDLDSENSVMVEEFRVESPGIFGSNTICSDSIILLEGEIVYCGFEFTSDSNLQISVNLAEDSPKGVDVLTMTSLNFQKFQDGEERIFPTLEGG